MLDETRWEAVPLQLFTVDGTAQGVLEVANAGLFKVGMNIKLDATSIDADSFIITHIEGSKITAKPLGYGPNDVFDLTAYTVADGANIEAHAQTRKTIPADQVWRYAYDEAPTIAFRTTQVDSSGDRYDATNPFPVDIGASSINVDVALTHLENFPNPGDVADSVQIGDGVSVMRVDPLNKSISANRYEKLLPLMANAKWLEQVNFESIVPIFAGDLATLEYMQGGNIVARLKATFLTDSNWNMVFESYWNDDDGSILLDDDNATELFID